MLECQKINQKGGFLLFALLQIKQILKIQKKEDTPIAHPKVPYKKLSNKNNFIKSEFFAPIAFIVEIFIFFFCNFNIHRV